VCGSLHFPFWCSLKTVGSLVDDAVTGMLSVNLAAAIQSPMTVDRQLRAMPSDLTHRVPNWGVFDRATLRDSRLAELGSYAEPSAEKRTKAANEAFN
jgi:hypothetical protein